jgi:hypothetical protein
VTSVHVEHRPREEKTGHVQFDDGQKGVKAGKGCWLLTPFATAILMPIEASLPKRRAFRSAGVEKLALL